MTKQEIDWTMANIASRNITCNSTLEDGYLRLETLRTMNNNIK